MKCITIDDNPVALAALQNLIEQVDFLELKGEYTNAVKALSALKKEDIDLLFLDVEMPDITGLELIDSLDNPPLIIMVTAKKQYAVDAFEKHVVDFLIKPVPLPRFLSAINFAQKIHGSRQAKKEVEDNLFIKSDGKWSKINIPQIKYLQAMGDYVRIFYQPNKSVGRQDNYMVNKTMKSVKESLPNDKFIRVHRSYIVNIDHIENIEDNSILIGKDIIPISERHKSDFMKHLNLL